MLTAVTLTNICAQTRCARQSPEFNRYNWDIQSDSRQIWLGICGRNCGTVQWSSELQ